MKILSIHNLYQIRGGEDECQEAEAQLLRRHGHVVYTCLENNERLVELTALQTAAKTVWSHEAYQRVRDQLKQSSVDVVHIHNFLPLLSPAVYYAAKAEGVPVVQTLHNYRLLCPNALFFRYGQVCTDCVGKAFPWPGVYHSCYRESRPASAVTATMLAFHRILRTWRNTVDAYITLTEFARQQFIDGGLPAQKIVVKPNFVDPAPAPGDGKGGFALYVGRLSVEKGLDTLLDAWEILGEAIPLKIVGDGPLVDLVKDAANRSPQVSWLGRRPMAEVYDLMGQASFLVFPSKWYETFGRVAIEAFAKGTPVVASNIGAISELVTSGSTGIHFRPGDAQDLAEKIIYLLAHPQILATMRQHARSEFEQRYTPEHNYKQLMKIYNQVLPKRNSQFFTCSPKTTHLEF